MEAGDRLLLKIVDNAVEEAVRRAGDRVVCRPGCDECCIGPFPITQLDARRLRRALNSLPPARSQAIRRRAEQAAALMRDEFARNPEYVYTRYSRIPCPVLNPESRLCELYDARPITCRTFGPAVRFGTHAPPPCRLCFIGSTTEEIEACRMDIDPDQVEEILLEELADRSETLIALALADQDDAPRG